jgi:hypothetical protein
MLCAFDLLEVNGEDIRREPIEDRKRRLAGLLRLPHDGIALNEAFRRRRRDDLQACVRAELRGHRFEAARVTIPRWPIGPLAQGRESGGARSAPARRGGLGLMKPRRFPQPWTSEETEACFIVKDRRTVPAAHSHTSITRKKPAAAHR